MCPITSIIETIKQEQNQTDPPYHNIKTVKLFLFSLFRFKSLHELLHYILFKIRQDSLES